MWSDRSGTGARLAGDARPRGRPRNRDGRGCFGPRSDRARAAPPRPACRCCHRRTGLHAGSLEAVREDEPTAKTRTAAPAPTRRTRRSSATSGTRQCSSRPRGAATLRRTSLAPNSARRRSAQPGQRTNPAGPVAELIIALVTHRLGTDWALRGAFCAVRMRGLEPPRGSTGIGREWIAVAGRP